MQTKILLRDGSCTLDLCNRAKECAEVLSLKRIAKSYERVSGQVPCGIAVIVATQAIFDKELEFLDE